MVYRIKWYNHRAWKAGASIAHAESAEAALIMARAALGVDYDIVSAELDAAAETHVTTQHELTISPQF